MSYGGQYVFGLNECEINGFGRESVKKQLTIITRSFRHVKDHRHHRSFLLLCIR